MVSDSSKAQPRPGPLAQLLGFPFSDYEQNLIHKYALQPPSTLPASSIPIIQELICVRQIQSGQYSSAIKLDRRFAATVIPGATPKMQKMIQERRKMMDELLATLPAVEKQLVEVELEAEASGSGEVEEPIPFFGKGKGRAEGLAMSWEELRHPNINANGSATPPRTVPQLGTPSAAPISARNAMPRFGGSVSRPPASSLANGSALLASSTSNTITPQVPNHIQSSPFTARANHVFPLSSSQSSRMPAPLLNSSGIKYPTPLFNQPSAAARAAPTPAAKPTTSLFSMAGSANQTRNAFYNPPSTNGVKRSLGEDEARNVADAPPPPNPADEPPAPVVNGNDVNMESDDDYARGDATSETNGNDVAPPAELSYSVFGNKSAAKQPPLKSRRLAKAGSTEMKMPPGAYVPDDDEIAAAATSQAQNQRHISASPPPPPQPTRQTRKPTTRTQKLAQESDLKRSLPGSFMAEEEEEEEDQVAPLPPSPPPSKRPLRKARSSRSVEPEDASARPTRRSTRLSTAPSVTSGSPEPPSPQRKSTRKSTKTSTSSKTKSRKK